ncbi:MAG: Dabb family protein, partial [Acidobacteriota bacterium]
LCDLSELCVKLPPSMRNASNGCKIGLEMLVHIVCWKYKPDTSEEQRLDHIAKLQVLADVIPNIESFDVGSDILHLDRSFDTGLVAKYPDRSALDFYNEHPEHQKVVALGKEIAEKVVSVDFMTG